MAFGRREFMKAVAGLASLAAAGRLIAADEADKAGQTADTARPNIILFLSDDHGYADSGVYGDTVVRTPNIDKLAAESMRFTQAYAASPLCVPSRCVIQTGRMPFSNGAHAFGTGMKPDVKMMPDYFRELGYYTAHVGKWHHGDGKQPVYDFKHASDRKALEILANHDKAKPLLLIICSHQPHLPWAKNESYDLDKIKLPPNFVDTPETRQCRAEYYTDVTEMDAFLGEVCQAVKVKGFEDNTLLVYTSDQGANWPFAKWCVYIAGLRVPFLARWPGHIKAGAVSDAMVSFADILPTFIQAAGGKTPAGIDGLSFLDVLAGKTNKFRDYVFGSHTGYVGKDLPGINNHSPARTIITRDYQYIVNLDSARPFDTHITGCGPKSQYYVAFWNAWVKKAQTDPAAKALVDAYRHRPVEELYDVKADPYERTNLAYDPKYAKLKQTLSTQLAQWRKEQGDDVPLIIPDKTPPTPAPTGNPPRA
jgi:arylsulfatase A-like enzyme